MSTTVTAYQTADGQLFATQKEANQYETMLAKRQTIKDFLASPDNMLQGTVRDEKLLLNFIAAWEEWRKTH